MTDQTQGPPTPRWSNTKIIAISAAALLLFLTIAMFFVFPRNNTANSSPEDVISSLASFQADHHYIAGWILECRRFVSHEDAPPWMRRAVQISTTTASTSQVQGIAVPLIREERALINLSSTLASERSALLVKARNSYNFWERTSILGILIGFLTTVLITISSANVIPQNSRWAMAVKALAIILPAVGTAFAAIVAFYTPQAEWSQASRTLSSNSLLHSQMRRFIASQECLFDGDGKPATGLAAALLTGIQVWERNYSDIQSSASISNRAGDAGSGARRDVPSSTPSLRGPDPTPAVPTATPPTQ